MKDYRRRITEAAGKKTKGVLRNMQKSVVSSTLNIARPFKIIT